MRPYLRPFFICLSASLSFAWPAAVSPAADVKHPNVLFIMADDLNNQLGCYGDTVAKTPNLDKLAARGVRFDRAYCQFPLCGPSRNCLLTGLYPNSTGILGNSQIFRQTIPQHHSMPQAFRLQGYFAVRIGKLYHYGVPTAIGSNGHDDPASWEMEINPAGVDRMVEQKDIFSLTPGQFGATLSWYASPREGKLHTDGMQAAYAEWVLERCAKEKDRPFFLALGFFRPHTPYVSPKEFFDLHPLEKMRVVQNVKEDQADLPPAALQSYKKEQDKLDDNLRRQALQAYRASTSFMDANVGRVIDTLDRLKLSDNTIIVFASDHGYHTGEHGLWQKMSLFEESARVPLLISGPGITKGAAGTPVGLVDVYPTLAELCHVDTIDKIQGQSLTPMLKDVSAVGRGWSVTQVTRNEQSKATAGADAAEKSATAKESTGGAEQPAAKVKGKGKAKANGKVKGEGGGDGEGGGGKGRRFFGYTLRTAKWRYTEWDEGKAGRELYDHDADPNELKNLADDPARADDVKQLSAQLAEAVKQTFPPDGKTPPIREGLWAPVLVTP